MQSAADHNQFMAKYPALQQMKSRVHEALTAAAAFLEAKQASTVQAFIQAPFTGTYTAQSGEVVGILKQMRDTFEANLATATATEEASEAQYQKIKAALMKAEADMIALRDE